MLVSLMTLLVGCGSTKSPEGVVRECWKRLSKGDVSQAVALMAAEKDEVELYCEIFEEQSGELIEAGGIDDFEVLSLSEGERDATVEAAVILKNGQRIEATYSLVKHKKGWLIVE